jgi:catalase
MAGDDLYERIIDAANALYGSHPHTRALHAKGTWCSGTFTPTAAAAELCRAAHFGDGPVPALIRFSSGSGDPESDDSQREARGMAVKLQPPEGEVADIVTVTTPAFVVRTPEEFLELLELRKPDPDTGQPDFAKLGAFLEAHPESQPAIQATLNSEPPASFATLVYRSPHTFKLVDAGGNATWARHSWRPEAGEATLPDDQAKARGPNYLSGELQERLHGGPAAFDLVFQIPEEGDPIDDPTAIWPDDREQVVAGRLEIAALVDDPEGDGHIEVFDPTRVVDGIELSDDPILHARARAYSVSAYKRLGLDVENPSVPPGH